MTVLARLRALRRDRYCRHVDPCSIVPAAEYGVDPACGARLGWWRWVLVGHCGQHRT